MATNTSITQTTVLDIETSKSVKSVKELKEQIKDLKNKILELNAAGESATEETTALGNAMRQMKEINEEAMRSSQDLGDQLSVASGAMKGMAGAVSTVTGLLGLMGVESEKGTKLLKVMASAMSITSGIQAMESGVKSVKSLISGFQNAVKGAKSAGEAIKMAFSTKNMGGILAIAGVIAVAIGSIVSKAKEANEAMKEAANNAYKAAQQAFTNFTSSQVTGTKRVAEAFTNMGVNAERAVKKSGDEGKRFTQKFMKDIEDMTFDDMKEFTKLMTQKTKVAQEQTKKMTDAAGREYESFIKKNGKNVDKYTDEQVDEYLKILEKYNKAYVEEIKQNTYAEKAWEEVIRQVEEQAKKTGAMHIDLTKARENLNAVTQALAQTENDYNNHIKEQETLVNKQKETREKAAEDEKKQAKENYKNAKTAAKARLEVEKKAIADSKKYAELKEQWSKEFQKRQAIAGLKAGEITEKQYEEEVQNIEDRYYNRMIMIAEIYEEKMKALKQRYEKNPKLHKLISKEDIENIYSQMDELQEDLDFWEKENERLLEERARQLEKAETRIMLNDSKVQTEIQQEMLDSEKQFLLQRLALEEEYAEQKWYISKDLNKKEMELIEMDRAEEDQKYQWFKEQQQQSRDTLKALLDEKIISQVEYDQRSADLLMSDTEREMQHSATLVELKKREVEAKKNIQKEYWAFEESVASSTSSLLNTIADSLGESNEHYKNIKIAATLIDTFQSSMAAYSGMVQAIPGPAGLIAGALAAAASIATGIATIQKIKAVDPKGNSSSSTASSSAVQTFTTPQQATIATGATNDYTDIMGNSIAENTKSQKVVVLLNDIDNAQQRKTQVVSSNTY